MNVCYDIMTVIRLTVIRYIMIISLSHHTLPSFRTVFKSVGKAMTQLSDTTGRGN